MTAPRADVRAMVRLVYRAVAALVGAALLVGGAATAQAGVIPAHRPPKAQSPAQAWAQRADQAISLAIASDPGNASAFQAAYLASGIAHRSVVGWRDPAATHYLQEALGQQQPRGGYGLPYAWDAFADHSVNPITTTYTASLFQVGDVMIEAYKAGVVPQSTVSSILDALFAQPRIKTPAGWAVAYSNAPADVRTGYATHNVNAAAAQLASEAAQAGVYGNHSPAVVSQFVRMLTTTEENTYRAATHDWQYADYLTRANDAGHNAFAVSIMMLISPSLGYSAMGWAMNNPLGDPTGFTAHALLARFSCTRSTQWFPEYDAAMTNPTFQTFNYYSQLARSAATDARACGGARDLAPIRR